LEQTTEEENIRQLLDYPGNDDSQLLLEWGGQIRPFTAHSSQSIVVKTRRERMRKRRKENEKQNNSCVISTL
jgi:hypothetical protein